MRMRKNDLVLPRFFLARFRSSPTTESLEQATVHVNRELNILPSNFAIV